VTRILCVGLATVDLVYEVASIPGVDEKAQASGLAIAAGGPAANAAVTASALGAEVTLVTVVGSHPLGELVRSDLRDRGIGLIDVDPHNPAPPPVSSVIVRASTGERTIVSRNGGDRAARVPENGLPDADLTLVDGHHPALAMAAARAARRLLVDAGSWRPVFREIFPYAEVVACSAAFRHPAAAPTAHAGTVSAGGVLAGTDLAGGVLAGTESVGGVLAGTELAGGVLAGTDLAGTESGGGVLGGGAMDGHVGGRVFAGDAATAAAIGAPHVAITHGAGAVTWFSGGRSGGGGRSGEIVVPPVVAVDTAGAGDAFHGALAVALARGEEFTVALASAVRVAGVRVVHRGPRAWLDAL
jgi:sugar/nucleoside kinase (ribokinase family)